jgi:hypothetical protein
MTTPDERSEADRTALLERRFTELVEQAIELGVPSADAENLAQNVFVAAIATELGDRSFLNNERWLSAELTNAAHMALELRPSERVVIRESRSTRSACGWT